MSEQTSLVKRATDELQGKARSAQKRDVKAELAESARTVLEPLSKATADMMSPLGLDLEDRLSMALGKDGRTFLLRTFKFRGDERVAASWVASHHFFERIPERKPAGYGVCEVAATDVTSLIINAIWAPEQLVFEDENAKTVHTYNLFRFMRQTRNAAMRAEFKLHGVVPQPPADFVQHPEHPLSPYQIVAFCGSVNQEGSALFMEQGTGKTPVAIARISYEAPKVHAKEKRMYRVLVVCPKNVRGNWKHELVKFGTARGNTTILRGGQLARMKLMVEAMTPNETDPQYTAVVCSYESVERTWRALAICDWDLIILDESHYIKSTYTKRFNTMMQFRDLGRQRLVLTGTPICNSLLDLYPQLEFLGDGMSGFNSWRNFRAFFGEYVDAGGHDKLVGYKNVPLLQERLARVAFMINSEEAKLQLPELSYDIVDVQMTDEQRDLYVNLQKRLAAEIAMEIAEGNEGKRKKVTAQHVLTKLLRLAQITSGHIKWDLEYDEETGLPIGDESKAEPIPGGNPKIDALMEILRDKKPNEKTIVWAIFVPDIKAIKEACDAAGIDSVMFFGGTNEKDRDEAVRRFNEDKNCKVFIGNSSAGGTGLNLLGYPPGSDGTDKDTGTNVTQNIYFSQDWSMVKRSQSEKRSHRRGTRVPVRCTDLVVPGTIDEEIRARVVEKRITATEFADVREIMRRILENSPDAND